jgi:hypothetical protein
LRLFEALISLVIMEWWLRMPEIGDSQSRLGPSNAISTFSTQSLDKVASASALRGF